MDTRPREPDSFQESSFIRIKRDRIQRRLSYHSARREPAHPSPAGAHGNQLSRAEVAVRIAAALAVVAMYLTVAFR